MAKVKIQQATYKFLLVARQETIGLTTEMPITVLLGGKIKKYVS